MFTRRPLSLAAALLLVAGCSHTGPSMPEQGNPYPQSESSIPETRSSAKSEGFDEEAAPTLARQRSESAPSPSRRSAPPPSESGAYVPPVAVEKSVERAARQDRPGLGTEWGENRFDPIEHVRFERASDEPLGVASLLYNDREGAQAMSDYEVRHGAWVTAPVPVAGRGRVSVSVVDEGGAPLSWFSLDEKVYVVGEAGRRYSLLIRNATGHRCEVVVSVDGLDVMDGLEASVEKRGYVLAPWSSYRVAGFRRSPTEVAAFRFGSVRGSYAARTGSDRNVGVIGVALFGEQGDVTGPWDDDEIERRRTARPFSDSRFARPPQQF